MLRSEVNKHVFIWWFTGKREPWKKRTNSADYGIKRIRSQDLLYSRNIKDVAKGKHGSKSLNLFAELFSSLVSCNPRPCLCQCTHCLHSYPSTSYNQNCASKKTSKSSTSRDSTLRFLVISKEHSLSTGNSLKLATHINLSCGIIANKRSQDSRHETEHKINNWTSSNQCKDCVMMQNLLNYPQSQALLIHQLPLDNVFRWAKVPFSPNSSCASC